MVAFENFLWLLVLIGVMILIHELGHFWAARYFGVRVEVFSFGFGPRLFGFRRGETDYRFSAILFGGYVKMAGEQIGDESAADPDSFLAKPRWQRLIIAAAGPVMNIVLSVVLLTGLYTVHYQRLAEPEVRGVIGYVSPGTPAAEAGLQAGDRIAAIDGVSNPSWEDVLMKEFSGAYQTMTVTIERDGKRFDVLVTPVLSDRTGVGSVGWHEKNEIEVRGVPPGLPAEKAGIRKGDTLIAINGKPLYSSSQLQEVVKSSGGKEVELVYERDGVQHTVRIKPVFDTADGQRYWMLGVQQSAKYHFVTTKLSLPDAFRESIVENRRNATLILQFLRGIVERRMSAKQLSGPIGIARLSGEAAREGAPEFLRLMSMVSLNLAIFNLLPIPILDGGVILLLLVEMIMRRDLSLSVKETVIKVGFVFLMLVTVFALYNDISRILPNQ